MRLFQELKNKIKYHLVLQSISDVFEKVGVAFIPYYIFQESIADRLNLKMETGLGPVEPGFLSVQEIEELCRKPENNDLAWEKTKLLNGHCKCFALKFNGEAVSYMVCNFRQCDSRLISFPLGENDVYLSRAFTTPACRGYNLAAFLERELYEQLHILGYKKYWSINVLYNNPGVKFKKKLYSRPAELRLFIRLLNYQRSIRMRKYRR